MAPDSFVSNSPREEDRPEGESGDADFVQGQTSRYSSDEHETGRGATGPFSSFADSSDAALSAYDESVASEEHNIDLSDETQPGEDEQAAETALQREFTLKDSDAGADSDLARAPRGAQRRIRRRLQVSMVLPAFLLMAIGALLLADNITPDQEELPFNLLVCGLVAALGAAMVARFVFNGRRERGLFLIGTVMICWVGLVVLVITEKTSIAQAWPFGLVAIGLALLLTYLFERSHDRGLILPAMVFAVMGVVAFPVALGLASLDLAGTIGVLWPLLVLILAAALLPRVFRPRTNVTE